MEAREGDQVDSELSEIAIQLAREAQAARYSSHYARNKVVEVGVCWGVLLQNIMGYVVQCFVV